MAEEDTRERFEDIAASAPTEASRRVGEAAVETLSGALSSLTLDQMTAIIDLVNVASRTDLSDVDKFNRDTIFAVKFEDLKEAAKES